MRFKDLSSVHPWVHRIWPMLIGAAYRSSERLLHCCCNLAIRPTIPLKKAPGKHISRHAPSSTCGWGCASNGSKLCQDRITWNQAPLPPPVHQNTFGWPLCRITWHQKSDHSNQKSHQHPISAASWPHLVTRVASKHLVLLHLLWTWGTGKEGAVNSRRS